MPRTGFMLIVWVLVLGAFACGAPGDKAVKIDAPEELTRVIEEKAPSAEFSFFAFDGAHPTELEDMTDRVLVVCGEIEPQAEFEIMFAAQEQLGKPLFKSARTLFTSERLVEGEVTLSESARTTLGSGEEVVIPLEKTIFAGNLPEQALHEKCLEAQRENPGSVMLLHGKKPISESEPVVEIRFSP